MKTVVTGASGFLGRSVVRRLLSVVPPEESVVLCDLTEPAFATGRAQIITGDLCDSATREAIVRGSNRIIHLAALPGGTSETDYQASRRINLEASLLLLESAANTDRRIQFVYASSIAVFGEPLPAIITDDTRPRPSMTYGAHKLMVEIALDNLNRMGKIDGLALRLPGILARDCVPSGLKSAYMSRVFHAMEANERITLPLSRDSTIWIMSATVAAENLVRAAFLSETSHVSQCAITLPALRVRMSELVSVIATLTGRNLDLVTYDPDPAIERQFGRLPPLEVSAARELGLRDDGDIQHLVASVLEQLQHFKSA